MQQLTERQCWKVIRILASEKNNEYKELLNILFRKNIEKTKQIQGYTRDAFLRKFNIDSLGQFFYQYREATESDPDMNNWLDNLNSESLLIFLDFRCRVLQRIYNYYAQYKNIDDRIITQIIDETKLSPLSKFKIDSNGNVMLSYSRKPGRAPRGEKKLKELQISTNDLYEQALAQVMGKLVGGYMQAQKVTEKDAMALASTLVTQNVNHKREKTGYQYQGKDPIVPQKPVVVEEAKSIQQENPKGNECDIDNIEIDENKMYVIGFGEDKMPIYLYKGQKVNFFREPIPYAKIVYDRNKNKIDAEYKYAYLQPDDESIFRR